MTVGPQDTSPQVLDAAELVVDYESPTGGSVRAVNNLSLTVAAGNTLAIKGRSGSGKSSLLAVLGLLLQPTSGSLNICGTNTAKLNDKELTELRSKTIGFVFQQFALLPQLTAIENVMSAQLAQGPKVARVEAANLLAAIGLKDRQKFRPNELSGGEQQRVAIARAAVNNPQIILADEPTGSLDSETEGHVMSSLRRIASSGTAVIVVTHSDEVAAWAERVVSLEQGQIVSTSASTRRV